MLTQTESLLQDIVREVEKYLELPSVSNMTAIQKEGAISRLLKIREYVSGLPREFTDRYSLIFEYIIDEFGNIRSSVPGATDINIARATEHLEHNFADIHRHANPDRGIQNGIIASQGKYLDQLYSDYYGRAGSLTIIISLTATLVVIRAALLNVGVQLSGWQILVYSLMAIPVAWVAWDIVNGHEKAWVYDDPHTNYSTHTQFFDMSCDSLNENIYSISEFLDKRKRNRKWQRIIWMITAGVSILVTIIIYFTNNDMDSNNLIEQNNLIERIKQ